LGENYAAFAELAQKLVKVEEEKSLRKGKTTLENV